MGRLQMEKWSNAAALEMLIWRWKLENSLRRPRHTNVSGGDDDAADGIIGGLEWIGLASREARVYQLGDLPLSWLTSRPRHHDLLRLAQDQTLLLLTIAVAIAFISSSIFSIKHSSPPTTSTLAKPPPLATSIPPASVAPLNPTATATATASPAQSPHPSPSTRLRHLPLPLRVPPNLFYLATASSSSSPTE